MDVQELIKKLTGNHDSHDEDCYFCKAKDDDPVSLENDLKADPKEDTEYSDAAVYVHKPFDAPLDNDPTKLGSALGGNRPRHLIDVKKEEHSIPLNVVHGAHHLIPGNESLENHPIKKYLYTHGEAKGNIGYNVNAAENGEWLPGPYAYTGWSDGGAKFKEVTKITPVEYEIAIMKQTRKQYHPHRHKKYSIFVIKALNRIKEKLDTATERATVLSCPEAAKRSAQDPALRNPLYMLVLRLNTMSARLRKYLTGGVESWNKNIFLSESALKYINESRISKIKLESSQ